MDKRDAAIGLWAPEPCRGGHLQGAGIGPMAADAFDPDPLMRLAAAQELPLALLAPFLDDPEALVREIAYERLVEMSLPQVALAIVADTLRLHREYPFR
jgi:hypothetical protein